MTGAVPWTKSATAIVRDLFAKHRYLKNQDIWKMGTEGQRPIQPPANALDNFGRIRMKRVSNIREGRRVWVPPPTAPLPDHPFQAMRFLKSNILKALESQGLIHNAKIPVPIQTAEELLEAEKSAMRKYRRMCFEADKMGKPHPTEVPTPRTHKMEYYWTLGPMPELAEGKHYKPPPLDEPLTPEEVEAKMPAEAWERAEKLENAFFEARAIERELIAARKAIRKAKHQAERQEAKAERERMREEGLLPHLAREKHRERALDSIIKYAQETGEDVSEWLQELEKAELSTTAPVAYEYEEQVNPRRVNGKLRLTPDVPRKNPARTRRK